MLLQLSVLDQDAEQASPDPHLVGDREANRTAASSFRQAPINSYGSQGVSEFSMRGGGGLGNSQTLKQNLSSSPKAQDLYALAGIQQPDCKSNFAAL